MNKLNQLALIALAAAALSACGPKNLVECDPNVQHLPGDAPCTPPNNGGTNDDISDTENVDGGVTVVGVNNDDALSFDALNDENSVLSNRTIYFEFNSDQIKTEYVDLLTEHGKYLASHPSARVTLEGHTDERGSDSYNLALGEHRAESVRKLLLFQGAVAEQMSVVSYGEEKPLDLGHVDDSWSKNRRVELIYDQK